MKNKSYLFYTLLVLLIFLNFFVIAAHVAMAGIPFTPNVSIPGSSFQNTAVVDIGGDSLGEYIVALYRYGASFAGAAAMFMLVLAGWRWLFAAGDSGKIAKAKETINGVLIGLLLLFGGYLLLAQISSGLVNFDTLALKAIPETQFDWNTCSNVTENPAGCGTPVGTRENASGASVTCIDVSCSDVSDTAKCMQVGSLYPCPPAIGAESLPNCVCKEATCDKIDHFDSCADYQNIGWFECKTNSCFGLTDASGDTINVVCGSETGSGECEDYHTVKCATNENCPLMDLNQDGVNDYCCEDSGGRDFCRLRTETSKCKS